MQEPNSLDYLYSINRHFSSSHGNELADYKEKKACYIRSLYANLTRMLPQQQSIEDIISSLQEGNSLDQGTQQQPVCFRPLVKVHNERPSLPNMYEREKTAKVEYVNLGDVYEKIQRRIDGVSKQRIANGQVHISVTSHAQLQDIHVYVEKCPEDGIWGADEDETGRLALPVTMGAFALNKQYLSVDLDSVYFDPTGEPFYKLSRVHANQRNLFRLVTVLVFIDGTRSQEFFSKTMRLRSKRNSVVEDEK